jgi:hypothetical protein
MDGGESKRRRRGRNGLVTLIAIVLVSGVAVSDLGILSYGPFSWQAYAQSYNGEACTQPSQCVSGFCVTDVCCDTSCNRPGERCNLPSRPGICIRSAPVPVMSHVGELIAVLTLVAGAWMGWRLRSR